jgi:hypothetical protein
VNRHSVDIDTVRERASATPGGLGSRVQRAPAGLDRTTAEGAPFAGPAGVASGALREEQLWFARAIMTPESAPAAVSDEDARRRLTSGPRLGAQERLEIYRRGYHARLVECLADDYGVLRHALGECAFEDLCRAYIARHPSESPNLNGFGRKMEAFCRREAALPSPTCVVAADLAALEWAIVEVIHAPSSPALTPEDLGEVPVDAWPDARLVPNAALRLLCFETPVNAYFQAVREGNNPPLPSTCPSATVVYRSGPRVWRMDLTVPMFDVLSALVAGQTLGTSLSRAEASLGAIEEEEAAARVLGWFREWVGSGLFVRVELGPSVLPP